MLLLLRCSSEPDTPNPASEKTQAARAHSHQDAKHLGTYDEQNPLSCVAPDILVSGITRYGTFSKLESPKSFYDPLSVPEQCTAIPCSCATHSSLPATLKRLPSNYLHKKLLRNVFVWKGLEWQSLKKKKNWHEELCILQNKMCCFLICFYNPNKFVSHTPRLEKGAVRQFRIAVCSQLRQGICCKAVAEINAGSLLCCGSAGTAPVTALRGR